MRKCRFILFMEGIFIFFFIGCLSAEQIHQSGWIGGSYSEMSVLSDKIRQNQSGAIFVSRVYENTPLLNAGIKEGDLIFKIDNEHVDNIKTFRKIIEKSKTGTKITLAICRDGEIIDCPITVGKEAYKKSIFLGIGLPLSLKFDLIPDPDFSIFGILHYERDNSPLELNSPESKYLKNISSKFDIRESWSACFAILVIGGDKKILTQEML